MDRDAFINQLRQAGFSEIVTVERPPGDLGEHAHPFEARALVLEGEITLLAGQGPRVYRPGDVFVLAAGQSHAESYGRAGVKYLVGRR